MTLSGCSIHLFEVKPPGFKPNSSNSSDGTTTTAESLVERSRAERKAGTKAFKGNIPVDPDFASAVGLSSSNCVQIVELKNDDLVIDFGVQACPSGEGLLPAEMIAFTLYYQDKSGTEWEAVLDQEPLGLAVLDVPTSTPILQELCTGDYASKCTLTVAGGFFSVLIEK